MRLLHNLINGSDIEKCPFRILIHLTVDDRTESADSLLHRHILAGYTGEVLCHMEGLGQETLDLTGTIYGYLILIGQFLHTQDGDDVLQFLVLLQHCLHLAQNGSQNPAPYPESL